MKTFKSNGIVLAYHRQGKGTPLVLIHGYPLDHTIWKPVVPGLENEFDVILPDLRGFGMSQPVKETYTIAEMAADITALLDHLGIDKAVVAGHSMGGYIALAFASTYPERLLGLGLVATQPGADTPEKAQSRYDAARAVEQQGVDTAVAAMPPKLTPMTELQPGLKELMLRQSPESVIGALKAMAERKDTSAALASFTFPVVILAGDADQLIPVEKSREMKASLPHAHLVELSGVGHMPMMEAPEETVRALRMLGK